MTGHVDPHVFLEAARPHLATGDAGGLARAVLDRWHPTKLASLLREDDTDVRRVSAVVLGLVGDENVIDCLARALHDPDAQVNQMVEHAMWSIWFRMSKPAAAGPFRNGLNLLAKDMPRQAVAQFRRAIDADPEFSEAFNQCAIAHFLMGQWRLSLGCCQEALALMPCHFGAAAGLGHCYAHLGDMEMAGRWYRRALKINPRMPAVARACHRLESVKV